MGAETRNYRQPPRPTPILYRATDPLATWHGHEQTGLSAEQFMTFNTVILALHARYYPTHKTLLLGTQDWSTLSSAAVVAIGRGYARSHSDQAEEFLDIVCGPSWTTR